MNEVFCIHCGRKNPEGFRFCACCGAPGPQMTSEPPPARPDGTRAAPVFSGGPERPGQPPYTPPGKTPLYQILLLAGACLLLAGALGFGAYKLFIKAPALDTPAFVNAAAGSEAPQETPRSTEPPAQIPSAAPAETPTAQAPAATPSEPSAAGVDFNSIIVGYEGPGVTEDEAYQMFGQPLKREPVEYPDAVDIFLTYDSFVLKYTAEDNIAITCYEVEITASPCPISVFGLAVGMDAAQVEAAMAGTPFAIDYQDPDGYYWVYTSFSTGQVVFIDFSNNMVTGYSVFYAS